MLAALAVVVAALASGSASAEPEPAPVFLLARDGGLSPFILRRDSEEFRNAVFPAIAQALAQAGTRAIGEEPFRPRFNVDGIEGDFSSRWMSVDLLHVAPQVPVDDAGDMAPYLVFVVVWIRTCRDDTAWFCTETGASVHNPVSDKSIFGTGQDVRYPIPSDYAGGGLLPLWLARSDALLRPLGAELARFLSERLTQSEHHGALHARTRGRDPADGKDQSQGRALATRKPTLMSECPTGFLTRLAGRLDRGRLSQEPPRIMCCLHAASGSMAEPSDGAPS